VAAPQKARGGTGQTPFREQREQALYRAIAIFDNERRIVFTCHPSTGHEHPLPDNDDRGPSFKRHPGTCSVFGRDPARALPGVFRAARLGWLDQVECRKPVDQPRGPVARPRVRESP
jgi:hypothetical protein